MKEGTLMEDVKDEVLLTDTYTDIGTEYSSVPLLRTVKEQYAAYYNTISSSHALLSR